MYIRGVAEGCHPMQLIDTLYSYTLVNLATPDNG